MHSVNIALHTGYYSKEEETVSQDVRIKSILYSSMIELWEHREEFDMFIVLNCVPDVALGLPSLKKYCLETAKTLFVDFHACNYLKGEKKCTDEQNVITIVEKGENCDLENKHVPPEDTRTVVLESSFYQTLTRLGEMDLAGIEHEGIPIKTVDGKIVSVYGNVKFEESTFSQTLWSRLWNMF